MARLNRHAKKKKHKRKLEQRYTENYCEWSNVSLLRDKLIREAEEDSLWLRKHPRRNNGWEYWKAFYISGRRGYAKKYSDKRIRQKYRQMIRKQDPEDIRALRGSDYEKEYDYNWTIW